MNSAFKFFTELIHFINKMSENSQEKEKLKIRIRYVKVSTQHLDQGVVDYESFSP